MFQQKKDPKNTKEFIYLRSVISSKNVQIMKVCVQSISQIRYQCHLNLGYLLCLYGHEESSSGLNEFVSW